MPLLPSKSFRSTSLLLLKTQKQAAAAAGGWLEEARSAAVAGPWSTNAISSLEGHHVDTNTFLYNDQASEWQFHSDY